MPGRRSKSKKAETQLAKAVAKVSEENATAAADTTTETPTDPSPTVRTTSSGREVKERQFLGDSPDVIKKKKKKGETVEPMKDASYSGLTLDDDDEDAARDEKVDDALGGDGDPNDSDPDDSDPDDESSESSRSSKSSDSSEDSDDSDEDDGDDPTETVTEDEDADDDDADEPIDAILAALETDESKGEVMEKSKSSSNSSKAKNTTTANTPAVPPKPKSKTDAAKSSASSKSAKASTAAKKTATSAPKSSTTVKKRAKAAATPTTTTKKQKVVVATSSVTSGLSPAFAHWLVRHADVDPKRVRAIGKQGLTRYADLAEYSEKAMKDLIYNVRKIVSPRSATRITVARTAVLTYTKVIGRVVDDVSMAWHGCLDNFAEEWESILSDASKEPKKIRDHARSNPTQLIESVELWAQSSYGVDKTSLAYLIRDPSTPSTPPALKPGKCYGGNHNSLMDEMVAHHPHDGVAYRTDNKTFALALDSALQTSIHYNSIKPYLKKGDGIGAWKTYKGLTAGKTYLENQVKTARDFLYTHAKWKPDSKHKLQEHITKFTAARTALQECQRKGISCQVPDDTEFVRLFLDSIKAGGDAQLQAALSAVALNQQNQLNDFAVCSQFLMDHGVKAEKKSNSSDTLNATISAATGGKRQGKRKRGEGSQGGSGGANGPPRYVGGKVRSSKCPNTGVDLRWYPRDDFIKLSKEKQAAVSEWLKTLSKPEIDLMKANARISSIQSENDKLRAAAAVKEPTPAPPKSKKAKIAAAKAGSNAIEDVLSGLRSLLEGGAIASSTNVQHLSAEEEESNDDASSSDVDSESDDDSFDADTKVKAASALAKLAPRVPAVHKSGKQQPPPKSGKKSRKNKKKKSRST